MGGIPDSFEAFEIRVKPLKIIGIALSVGVLLVVAIMTIARQGQEEVGGPGVLTWVALAIGVQTLALSLILPKVIRNKAISSLISKGAESPEQLAPAYMTSSIIGGALAEGGGMFGAIVWMIEGHPIAFALALVSAVVTFFVTFAGSSRIRDWFEDARTRLSRSS